MEQGDNSQAENHDMPESDKKEENAGTNILADVTI